MLVCVMDMAQWLWWKKVSPVGLSLLIFCASFHSRRRIVNVGSCIDESSLLEGDENIVSESFLHLLQVITNFPHYLAEILLHQQVADPLAIFLNLKS